MKKLSSFGFKAAFVRQKQDPKFLQDIERGKFCLPFSRACTYNGKVAKYSINQSIIFIGPQMSFINDITLNTLQVINKNKKESYY